MLFGPPVTCTAKLIDAELEPLSVTETDELKLPAVLVGPVIAHELPVTPLQPDVPPGKPELVQCSVLAPQLVAVTVIETCCPRLYGPGFVGLRLSVQPNGDIPRTSKFAAVMPPTPVVTSNC